MIRLVRINKRCLKKATKGAIALFLAVLMTPFLSILMLLVETGRYNSAVSTLEEAMGVSAVSTLANYDTYLQDRWGLLAVSQGADINSVYNANMSVNAGVLGDSLVLNTLNANGEYSLSQGNVLYNQIIEYCKLNAPTELATNFLNVADLIKSIEKLANVDKIISMLTAGVKTADSGITMAECAETLKTTANELDTLVASYEVKYTNFATGVNNLIDALKVPRPDTAAAETALNAAKNKKTAEEAALNAAKEKENTAETAWKQAKNEKPLNATKVANAKSAWDKAGEERKKAEKALNEATSAEASAQTNYNTVVAEAQVYDNNIASLRGIATSAKTEYSDLLGEIEPKLTLFQTTLKENADAIKEIIDSVATITDEAVSLAQELDKNKKELKKVNEKIEQFEKDGFSKNDTVYAETLKKQAGLETKVQELEMTSNVISAEKSGISSMVSGWNTTFDKYSDEYIGLVVEDINTVKGKVDELDIAGVTSGTSKIAGTPYKCTRYSGENGWGYISAANIGAYLDEQKKELTEGSLSTFIDGMIAFYEAMMSMQLFYDPSLSAYIDKNYYDTELGGLPGNAASGGAMLIFENIGNVIEAAGGLVTSIKGLDFAGILKELKALFNSTIAVFESINAFFGDIIKNIVDLITGYDRLYYTTYTCFNLTCRTDYSSFETMTGYKVPKTALADVTVKGTSVSAIDDILSLVKTLKSAVEGTGTDLTFSGAELEYILFGSNSEIANQLYAFVSLYLFRLLLDIVPVMGNGEVQSLAAASTFGYPAVMVIEVLLQPLMDTVLLVNGQDISLISGTVYLTPTGIPKLVEKLVKVGTMTTAQKEALADDLVSSFGQTKDDYDYQKKLYDYANPPSVDDKKETFGSKYFSSLTEFNYREHCFFIMLLMVAEEEQMNRLRNLVQMETLNYYNNTGEAYIFDLDESYTFIKAEANVTVKQMLPSLTDSSWFTVNREIYRGY